LLEEVVVLVLRHQQQVTLVEVVVLVGIEQELDFP
jgi:hypothetical protein